MERKAPCVRGARGGCDRYFVHLSRVCAVGDVIIPAQGLRGGGGRGRFLLGKVWRPIQPPRGGTHRCEPLRVCCRQAESAEWTPVNEGDSTIHFEKGGRYVVLHCCALGCMYATSKSAPRPKSVRREDARRSSSHPCPSPPKKKPRVFTGRVLFGSLKGRKTANVCLIVVAVAVLEVCGYGGRHHLYYL